MISHEECESSKIFTGFDLSLGTESKTKQEVTAALDGLHKVKQRVLESVSSDTDDHALLDTGNISSSRSLFENTATRMKSDFGTINAAKAGTSNTAGDRAEAIDRSGTSEMPGTSKRLEITPNRNQTTKLRVAMKLKLKLTKTQKFNALRTCIGQIRCGTSYRWILWR